MSVIDGFNLAATCGNCCVTGCAVPYPQIEYDYYQAGGTIIDSGVLYKASVIYDNGLSEEIHSDAVSGIVHPVSPYFDFIDLSIYSECIWANLPSTTTITDEVITVDPDFLLLYIYYSGGVDEWGLWEAPDGQPDEYNVKGKYSLTPPDTFDPDFDDWIIVR